MQTEQNPGDVVPCGSTEPPKLFRQGAEARLFVTEFCQRPMILKERFAKVYRHPSLDARLRAERMRAEVRTLSRCMQLGIRVPALYTVDQRSFTIGMQYFPSAVTVREFIESNFNSDDNDQPLSPTIQSIANQLGTVIGRMHANNIIHGDLTTSNVLLINVEQIKQQNSTPELVMIDFGLSYVDQLTEDKGVDLYVLERALISAHPGSQPIFDSILTAYADEHKKGADAVLKKLDEVRARGRKRDMTG